MGEELREYTVDCRYHIEESCQYKFYARSEQDAAEIARRQFVRDHTLRCHLDDMSVSS